jgi:chorismate mutase
MSLRAARGAITVSEDIREQVLEATGRLLSEMLARNDIDPGEIVSVLFTATDDLTVAFPAEAARKVGLVDVPLLCARELSVRDGLPRCIRVLMHFETARDRSEVRHVYLEEARGLRDDHG